jgi:antitoxin component of MazEF toxin-antitoxin module
VTFSYQVLWSLLKQKLLPDRLKDMDDKEITLEYLLERITPDNLHDEVDFGKPEGNEVL